ncbi:MAG: hypothetical protein KF824_02770 [Fimbriimonadaceae bacterium]|nr:MAG: hypothetical protein KF824_02770 [Fimbriimonadaceae bacterium]
MNLIPLTTSFPVGFFIMFGRITPIVFIAIPLILTYILALTAKKLRRPDLRKFAYIPLLLGVVVGIAAQIQFMNEPMYLEFNDLGNKSKALFWGIIVVPILAGIAMFFSDKFSKRSIDSDL